MTVSALNQAPTASFTFNCTGLDCTFDVRLTDTDGTIVSYVWDYGDGASGSGANPSHSYASGGSYQVTLTVTDDDGATTTRSRP